MPVCVGCTGIEALYRQRARKILAKRRLIQQRKRQELARKRQRHRLLKKRSS